MSNQIHWKVVIYTCRSCLASIPLSAVICLPVAVIHLSEGVIPKPRVLHQRGEESRAGQQNSKSVVWRLDPLRAQVNVALRPVMRRVNEHVHNHRAAVRIVATFPRRDVPGALQCSGVIFGSTSMT